MTLTETLKDPAKKAAVVADGARMIDEEVAAKGGLSGMALKGGYKTVKKLKPGMIESALDQLLPAFAPVLDPYYAKAAAEGNVAAYFRREAGPIADALLGVTDAKAAIAKNAVMKKVYTTLRPAARGHVMESLPRLAELIARHVDPE